MRVDHAQSRIVQLRVGNICTSDQHGQNVGRFDVLVTRAGYDSRAAACALQAALTSAVQTSLVTRQCLIWKSHSWTERICNWAGLGETDYWSHGVNLGCHGNWVTLESRKLFLFDGRM